MTTEKEVYYIRQWDPQINKYLYLTMLWHHSGEWTTQESYSRVPFQDRAHAERVIKSSKFEKAEAFTDRANRFIEKRKPSAVRLIKADNWEAIVINNELVAEGHRFSTKQVLEILQEAGILEYIYEDHYDDPDEDGIQQAISQYVSTRKDNE